MNERNLLKRYLKKKFKITDCFLVAFFITGNLAFSEEIASSNDKVLTFINGNGVIASDTLKNSGTILSKGNITFTKDNKDQIAASTGNGIGYLKDRKNPIGKPFSAVENSGIIQGENNINFYSNNNYGHYLSNNGNGIINSNGENTLALSTLKNSGAIKGILNTNSQGGNISGIIGENSANGILVKGNKVSLTEVNNSGIIEGYNSQGQNINFEHLLTMGNGLNFEGNNINIDSFFNTGLITGHGDSVISSNILNSNNGVEILGKNNLSINNLKNTGIISGQNTSDKQSNINNSGNGLFLSSSGSFNINSFENTGMILGSGNSFIDNAFINSGNGMYLEGNNNELKNLSNRGVISGNINRNNRDSFSGAGVVLKTNGIFSNQGTIKGSNSGMALNGSKITVNNYGLIAGNKIYTNKFGSTTTPTYENNLGLYIELNSNNNNSTIKDVKVGKGGEVTIDSIRKKIINGTKLENTSETNELGIFTKQLKESKDLILNGTGINKGAVIVNSQSTLNDSIINSYGTGLELIDTNSFIGNNLIINGGGKENITPVIKGDQGDNKIVLNNTIVNGNISLNEGNDNITIMNNSIINGNIDGNQGQNNLTLENTNISNNISNFENMNVTGNVNLGSQSKVTGIKNIQLSNNSNLALNIDPTKNLDGKVIGHGLYGNKGTISSQGGNLVLNLNGLGKETVVNLDNKLDNNVVNHIKTNSSLLQAKGDSSGMVTISTVESLPLPPSGPSGDDNTGDNIVKPTPNNIILYSKLNDIYKSIRIAGEDYLFADTNSAKSQSPEEILSLLNQIYGNNPYSYSLKASRDSLKLFTNNMDYLTIKPKYKEQIAQGRIISSGVRNDNTFSGKNYYGYDKGERTFKTTTSTVGAIGTYEYGLTPNISLGLVLGGNNQDVNFTGTSKLKGDSLYIGSFIKTEKNRVKVKTGIGYQYSSLKGDRNIANSYDIFKNNEKYHTNSMNLFLETKYRLLAEENWNIEPKIQFDYYYINQEAVKENYTPGNLAMEMEKTSSNTGDIQLGVDFIHKLPLTNSHLKNILSLNMINTLGEREKALHGRILGNNKVGSSFDVEGVKLPKTSGEVAYNLEWEKNNGMIYGAGISFEFGKNYNRSLMGNISIGYKF